jgi:hypothetical protein
MSRISQLSPLDAEAGARLVGAPDAETFGTALLEIARSITGIEELFGYIVLDEHEPKVLISKSLLPGVEDRVRHYVQRYYRHDPAVSAIRKIKTGDSFVQRISLTNIIPHDYRTHCFTEPGFTEKLSFGWRGESYLLVVSFYSTSAQDREALAKLASLANLTLAAMVRQHSPEQCRCGYQRTIASVISCFVGSGARGLLPHHDRLDRCKNRSKIWRDKRNSAYIPATRLSESRSSFSGRFIARNLELSLSRYL